MYKRIILFSFFSFNLFTSQQTQEKQTLNIPYFSTMTQQSIDEYVDLQKENDNTYTEDNFIVYVISRRASDLCKNDPTNGEILDEANLFNPELLKEHKNGK